MTQDVNQEANPRDRQRSIFGDIQSRVGSLIPLRTKAEVEARLALIDAYAVEINVKGANIAAKYANSFPFTKSAIDE